MKRYNKVSVTMSDEEKAALDYACKRAGMSKSQFLRAIPDLMVTAPITLSHDVAIRIKDRLIEKDYYR